jgi:hypothetical protein
VISAVTTISSVACDEMPTTIAEQTSKIQAQISESILWRFVFLI